MKLRNLILACLFLLGAWHAAQAAIEDWSTTAASNNSTAPDGAPEGMAPSAVNNVIREVMAQVRRWAEQQIHGTWNADAGSADAYVINPPIEPSSLVSGQVFRFKAAATNTGASNLKVGDLSTATIAKISNTDLEAGDIVAGVTYTVVYDGTYFQLQPTIRALDDITDELDVITTRGDIIRGDSSGDPERLAVGSSGTFLKSDGTDPSWGAITSSELPAGTVLQITSAVFSEVDTGTNTIPDDDSIPQNTEGDEYMTLSITPKSSDSILIIEVVANGAFSVAAHVTLALFQDSTADALAAVQDSRTTNNHSFNMSLRHKMTAGTTSATTFKVRIGAHTSGTYTFNGRGGSRTMGGVMASSITIMEVAG